MIRFLFNLVMFAVALIAAALAYKYEVDLARSNFATGMFLVSALIFGANAIDSFERGTR